MPTQEEIIAALNEIKKQAASEGKPEVYQKAVSAFNNSSLPSSNLPVNTLVPGRSSLPDVSTLVKGTADVIDPNTIIKASKSVGLNKMATLTGEEFKNKIAGLTKKASPYLDDAKSFAKKSKGMLSAVPFLGSAIGVASALSSGDASAALPILNEADDLGPAKGSPEAEFESGRKMSPEDRLAVLKRMQGEGDAYEDGGIKTAPNIIANPSSKPNYSLLDLVKSGDDESLHSYFKGSRGAFNGTDIKDELSKALGGVARDTKDVTDLFEDKRLKKIPMSIDDSLDYNTLGQIRKYTPEGTLSPEIKLNKSRLDALKRPIESTQVHELLHGKDLLKFMDDSGLKLGDNINSLPKEKLKDFIENAKHANDYQQYGLLSTGFKNTKERLAKHHNGYFAEYDSLKKLLNNKKLSAAIPGLLGAGLALSSGDAGAAMVDLADPIGIASSEDLGLPEDSLGGKMERGMKLTPEQKLQLLRQYQQKQDDPSISEQDDDMSEQEINQLKDRILRRDDSSRRSPSDMIDGSKTKFAYGGIKLGQPQGMPLDMSNVGRGIQMMKMDPQAVQDPAKALQAGIGSIAKVMDDNEKAAQEKKDKEQLILDSKTQGALENQLASAPKADIVAPPIEQPTMDPMRQALEDIKLGNRAIFNTPPRNKIG